MVKFKVAVAAAKTSIFNAYAVWRDTRLENKKRRWTAYRIGGGGVVPLGKVNQSMALQKVSLFGSISYVDSSVACIFYTDKFAR